MSSTPSTHIAEINSLSEAEVREQFKLFMVRTDFCKELQSLLLLQENMSEGDATKKKAYEQLTVNHMRMMLISQIQREFVSVSASLRN